jgi:predicted transcriptional regulator
VKEEVLRVAREGSKGEPEPLRRLDARARAVLALFARQERITTPEVARLLGLSGRTARLLLKAWTEDGWLVVAGPSRRGRGYELSASYRQLIGNSTAIDAP